jgi:hypothetical protein
MKQHQLLKRNTLRQSNADLLGRSLHAGSARITVVSEASANPAQVVIARDLDGKSWAVPAGLVRLILDRAQLRTRKKSRPGVIKVNQ